MAKRKLIAELTEGFDALAAARKGKKTLRTTEVILKPTVEVSANSFGPFGKSSTCRDLCLPATSGPIPVRLRTGSRAALSQTRKQHC